MRSIFHLYPTLVEGPGSEPAQDKFDSCQVDHFASLRLRPKGLPEAKILRMSYNGITSGFQPDDKGSIPFFRSKFMVDVPTTGMSGQAVNLTTCEFESRHLPQYSLGRLTEPGIVPAR